MKFWKKSLTALAMAALFARGAMAETAEEKAARMKWFNDARFGMFVHWGLYAVPAGEWDGKKNYGEWIMESAHIPSSTYQKFADQFNPTEYNPEEWARLAKEAGMKYLVITSKHHDGFCLWPTKVNDWSVARTPWKKDLLMPLKEACDKQGVKFCLYHSIMDWTDANYAPRRAWNDLAKAQGEPNMDKFVNEKLKPQLKEIIETYQPGIVWFDGEWEGTWDSARGADLQDYVRSLKSDVIINNRVGKSRAGMAGMDEGKEKPLGDYGTPEQRIPPQGFGKGVYWESCMTMNGHWGFNKTDKSFKSTSTLVRNLIDCASKGGNYLLNVGPTPEGRIPDESIQRLKEMGQWMQLNGTAIYETSASPFARSFSWGRVTSKPGKLFLHVFTYPPKGEILLPGKASVKAAYALRTPDSGIMTSTEKNGILVNLPLEDSNADANDKVAKVYVIEYEGDLVANPFAITADDEGNLICKADDAVLTGAAHLEEHGKVNNIGYWTDTESTVTFPIQIAKPGEYKMTIDFACLEASAGSKVEFTAGDQKLSFEVPSTGGWDKFTSVEVGTMNFKEAGDLKLVIKATSKKGEAVMNVRSVTLAKQ